MGGSIALATAHFEVVTDFDFDLDLVVRGILFEQRVSIFVEVLEC